MFNNKTIKQYDPNHLLNHTKVLSLRDVWLKYRIEFKEDGRSVEEDFWALKGIDMDVYKSEAVGIIGENGAGKTTLLKVIAGMLKPDKGILKVNGRVSTLIEIGAGFQRDLTGRENIYLISSLFGLTKEEIDARYNDIVKFASIGRFINAPVKIYSHGMYMRLAFAIAIHVDPDILLVDDVFVVGDLYAQKKCLNKMFELKDKGMTFLFIFQDLEMSKRLCSRGVFLRNGEIIKDGPMDKVSSYYTETVGDKKGIAIVENGPLGIVFNNGRLILRWKDRTITRNLPSGNSTMISSDRLYVSSATDWEIQESKNKNEIVAVGKWPDININQQWKISFLNENEFIWEITIDTPEEISVERFQTLIAFLDEYKSWFTLDTEMNFPESFIHEKVWECITVNSPSDKVIGLKGSSNTVEPLPIITLEESQDNIGTICHVGNTDSEIGGRVIQYQVFFNGGKNNCVRGSYRYFSCKVRIFEAEENEKLSLYLSHTKQLLQESAIIRRDFLSVFCKNNSVEIYWRNKLLTCGRGLNTIFRYQNINYSALGGCWHIFKKNDEEIIITISWDDKPPFTQIWRLQLQSDDTIIWEIEMNIDEKIKLRNKEVELLLGRDYERWVTAEEKGNFDKLEKKGCCVILNKYINTQIGVESINKKDGFHLPGVLFNCEDGSEAHRVSFISKIKEENWSTKLRYTEIDSKKNFYTLPGRCEYFKGKIRVFAKDQEDNSIKQLDKRASIISRNVNLSNKLELNRLSLVFNYGQGRIFWKDIELTKGLGIYSSVFFRGLWYDSSQAFWEVQRLDKERLIAVGNWSWISLIQTWDITILDETTISWKIAREIWEDVLADREQVNIMLSDKYKKWFVNKQAHGKFPRIFGEHNGIFWDRLWCRDKILPIGVKKCKIKKNIFGEQFLPSIVFHCSRGYQARYSIIENTDNLFQARILQYELDSNQINDSDKNKYFEGQIKIITE
jgi:ABC-type polysaccharide/polyol phosphate transport system ATPase subunit